MASGSVSGILKQGGAFDSLWPYSSSLTLENWEAEASADSKYRTFTAIFDFPFDTDTDYIPTFSSNEWVNNGTLNMTDASGKTLNGGLGAGNQTKLTASYDNSQKKLTIELYTQDWEMEAEVYNSRFALGFKTITFDRKE